MTRTRMKIWLPTALAGLALLAGHHLGLVNRGALSTLTGAGAVSFGTMLYCGYCLGAGAALLASDTWVAFLADPGSWKLIGACAAACGAVLVG